MSTSVSEIIAGLLLGESSVMRELRQRVARVARASLPVLIEGPTGAGKELVAQALHRASGRSGSCVAVNVCAVAEGMFEDAFFGHTRGAFTGALTDHVGYFTEAHRGTIFLDEIGGLSLVAQAKLLRAVETRQFRPVGARADHTSDFRVVSASNTPLHVMTHAGSFRLDLAERLRAVLIHVPALAARGNDSVLLASHFAACHGLVLSTQAKRLVAEHPWPGNVRQLRNAIECAVSFTDDGGALNDVILRECIGELTVREQHDSGATTTVSVRSFKDRRMLAVLEESRGDVDAAATALGIHRATLYRRLNRLRGSAEPGGAASVPTNERLLQSL